MAPLFDHLERLLERVVEAPGRRLFGARLQPVELARAIGRAMETETTVGPHGLIVPNLYRLELHPSDYHSFARWQRALERDLARFVEERASGRGWLCPARCVVQLASADDVPRGRPRIVAETADPTLPESMPVGSARSAEDPAATKVLVAVAAPTPAGAAGTEAWLELQDSRRFSLNRSITTMGRADDNDVVVAHTSVSRYHARIERRAAGYRIVDLGSHNGTRVGDRTVQEQDLRTGDTIHLGAVPLRFQGRS